MSATKAWEKIEQAHRADVENARRIVAALPPSRVCGVFFLFLRARGVPVGRFVIVEGLAEKPEDRRYVSLARTQVETIGMPRSSDGESFNARRLPHGD
jgi:hypothetical protein